MSKTETVVSSLSIGLASERCLYLPSFKNLYGGSHSWNLVFPCPVWPMVSKAVGFCSWRCLTVPTLTTSVATTLICAIMWPCPPGVRHPSLLDIPASLLALFPTFLVGASVLWLFEEHVVAILRQGLLNSALLVFKPDDSVVLSCAVRVFASSLVSTHEEWGQ